LVLPIVGLDIETITGGNPVVLPFYAAVGVQNSDL